MSKEMEFTIFCVENYKQYKNLTGKQTVELFNRYGVFDYLRPVHHWVSIHPYINHDIDIYLNARNATITA